MLLVEVKIKILVKQAANGLINKKYNVIISKNMGILHMNAGRNIMTRENKGKTNQATLTLQPSQCFWHVHPQLNTMLSMKLHVKYGI